MVVIFYILFYRANMMRLCVVYNWGRGDEHSTTGKYYKSLPGLGFPGGVLVKKKIYAYTLSVHVT